MKAVVVVEPEIPENTGFIARLAANFNYQLRLVKPAFNLSEARQTASTAQEKLRNARIYRTVEDAVKDLDYIVGTKPGKGKELSNFQPRKNTSIMIGRESSGLSNQELSLCDTTIHIQTGEHNSINQSHAAAITMYSLNTDNPEKGVDKGIKNKLEDLLGDTDLKKLIIQANPTQETAGKIIAELRQIKKSD